MRRATVDDSRALAQQRALLHCEVSKTSWSEEHVRAFIDRCEAFFRETIASGEYAAWIAEEDGAIVGGGGALFRRALPSIMLEDTVEVKIQSMYVVPERRNNGIGRAIVQTIIAYLKEKRCERINLSPAVEAKRFYEELGFTDWPYMRL